MKAADLIAALSLFEKYATDGDDLQVRHGQYYLEIGLYRPSSVTYLRQDEMLADDIARLEELGFECKDDICWCQTKSY